MYFYMTSMAFQKENKTDKFNFHCSNVPKLSSSQKKSEIRKNIYTYFLFRSKKSWIPTEADLP